MSIWFDEVFDDVCRFGLAIKEKLFSGRSRYQQVEVMDSEGFGRVLTIDGMFMTSERDEYFYHEMLVHPVLASAPSIRRVLVIGGGDGGTVREVLSYKEVEQVVMVEIDEMVVNVSKELLGNIGTAWDDERLTVLIADGIDYVRNAADGSFDVILLDHSDPVGPAEGLFNEAFYQGCKRLLGDRGVFCLQSESPIIQRPTFVEVCQTLKGVFREVRPYFGTVPIYPTGAWSWTFASNGPSPFDINEDRAAFQEGRCRHYNRDIHRGAFAVPNELKPLIG